jgi:hypothetical protein
MIFLSLGILGRHKCNYIVWGHGQKKSETCIRRSIKEDHGWTF